LDPAIETGSPTYISIEYYYPNILANFKLKKLSKRDVDAVIS